jgi:hypothetical protein
MSSSCHVDWCGHDAARYAVERWHYSHCLPGGKRAALGVWEDDQFIGAVVFGSGATPMIGRPFGLGADEVCELVRVALGPHRCEVSQVLAISTRMLHHAMPGLRLVVSFADTAQGHDGGIYRAAGWVYLGASGYHVYVVCGRPVHPRTLHSRYGTGGQSIRWLHDHVDAEARRVRTPPKHKYAIALDIETRVLLEAMRRPYPPARAGGVGASTDDDQSSGDGAKPIPALETDTAKPGRNWKGGRRRTR